ncbi:efflux RND transporter permease subunit [Shimia sp. SDUM112013]|uniref:efflux RND transporter permease subunit n=1 Tax=Shimia sp. SDUM112013 TaxID=3136160 RepID=UPI0032EC5E58
MIDWFVRHPVAANLLMALICVLGLTSIGGIKRETFPDITPSTVIVSVIYPGSSAVDVDEEICTPIEDALTGTTGLAELTCLSLDGVATATAELVEGGNVSEFYNDVFSAVSEIDDFPSDAEPPSVKMGGRTELIAMLAVSGISGKEGLKSYADELAETLQQVPGVSEARVTGITDRELRIMFDEQALQRFGVSGREIVSAINARSLRQPLGSLEADEGSVVLRYSDARRTITELQDLIILENDAGGMVRLSDLARIQLVDKDENQQSFINGDQAAILYVFKANEADAIRTFDGVEAVLRAEEAAYPDPFKITVTFNMTDLVEERLTLILKNTAIGLALVFGTMWLFFSFGHSLWISASLPVSFLGTMFLMQALGVSINMLTLVALLMAVGLIMDDSIVIAENIDRHRRKLSPYDAASRGTREVMPGVASSFLTTACVFGPLMFLSGDMGQVLRFIPIVLLMTLALSLVEAFLILPHHLAHAGRGTHGAATESRASQVLNRVKEAAVIPVVKLFVRWRYLTLGAVFGLLIVTVGMVTSGMVKVVGFPTIEGDTVQARFALSSGITRERTIDTVDQMLAALDRVDAAYTPLTDGQEPLVKRVMVQYGVNADVNDNGSHSATIVVDLLESARRNVSAQDFLRAWRAETGPVPDLVQSSFAQAEMGPGGADVDIEISGRDPVNVERAATALLQGLQDHDGVTEVYQDFFGGRQEVQLALNPYGYAVGLTPQSLAEQLRNAFAGSETDSFRTGASNMAVRVQIGDSVANLSALETFPVLVGQGKKTALSTVADLRVTTSYPNITRRNGKVIAHVVGQLDRSVVSPNEVAAHVTNVLAPEVMAALPDVQIANRGAVEDQQRSQSSILGKLIVGLVGVYAVLAFQFRSYTLPIVIMLSIPFALIGTILGHWATGINLAMPSFIGFASLAGIVVNNAILFLTFFQSNLQEEDHVSAAIDAVRDRFRPILISTGTTIAGLLPLISDGSPQVQTMVPLVVAVASGLAASMVLVVLVLPATLTIYFDMVSASAWKARFTGGPEAGSVTKEPA